MEPSRLRGLLFVCLMYGLVTCVTILMFLQGSYLKSVAHDIQKQAYVAVDEVTAIPQLYTTNAIRAYALTVRRALSISATAAAPPVILDPTALLTCPVPESPATLRTTAVPAKYGMTLWLFVADNRGCKTLLDDIRQSLVKYVVLSGGRTCVVRESTLPERSDPRLAGFFKTPGTVGLALGELSSIRRTSEGGTCRAPITPFSSVSFLGTVEYWLRTSPADELAIHVWAYSTNVDDTKIKDGLA